MDCVGGVANQIKSSILDQTYCDLGCEPNFYTTIFKNGLWKSEFGMLVLA